MYCYMYYSIYSFLFLMSKNFSTSSITKYTKDDRVGAIEADTNKPTQEDIFNLETIIISFIESVNSEKYNDDALTYIYEHRHIFKYYDEESSSRVTSSDFIESLFILDFYYPLKWKAIHIIASMIYKDSPFINQIIDCGIYDSVIPFITQYQKGERNYEEPFALRTIGGLQILCNLASISKSLIEPLLEPKLRGVLFDFFPCVDSLYLPIQNEKFCLAIHALSLISQYTDEYIKQSFNPFWALLEPKFKTMCPSVVLDSIRILISYFSNVVSINHINISRKLPFLFSYINEKNEISDSILELFVEISSQSQLAEELVKSDFMQYLLQSMNSGINLYLSYLIIANILSNDKLVDGMLQIDGLIDMIKNTIMNGSVKEGMGASLCLLKFLYYIPIEQAYQIVDSEIIDQLISYLGEEDNMYLAIFLQSLNKVISNEIALSNPEERLFCNAIISSDSIPVIEDLSIIGDSTQDAEIIRTKAKSILEMLQSR